MEYFVFKVRDRYFAIGAHYVYRIVDDLMVTPVPLLPACYEGLSYYRGELFDVVNADIIVGKEKEASKKSAYIILLKWDQHNLGLIPDHIVGLKWIDEENPQETDLMVDGLLVKVVTPEAVWQSISGMDYGPEKI
ncbi:MAG: chemotaxis protein CheW [Deltaproteobacteria bacterium]|nr:chemotaxis protein CheW [Deltaproteobacteria bacterium]